MKIIKFDNLIDSKTGKAVELEVDDDFDMKPLEEWSDRAKDSARRMREAFSEKELLKEGHAILDKIEDNLDTIFPGFKEELDMLEDKGV